MRRPRDERGSAAIEAVMLAPVLMLFFAMTLLGGRIAMAHQAVGAAAADAARSASIARTASTAQAAGTAAGQSGITNQGLTCATTSVNVDTSQFHRPVGTPATVTATITCAIPTAELGLPVAGTITVTATQSSPLDTYRER